MCLPIHNAHIHEIYDEKPKQASLDKLALNVMVLRSSRAALPFPLKTILRQKKNYGNSNISPYNLQKNLVKETKFLQDIIIL
jgi:hypothetical protein